MVGWVGTCEGGAGEMKLQELELKISKPRRGHIGDERGDSEAVCCYALNMRETWCK